MYNLTFCHGIHLQQVVVTVFETDALYALFVATFALVNGRNCSLGILFQHHDCHPTVQFSMTSVVSHRRVDLTSSFLWM